MSVVGVGLIGGSIAAAVKQRSLARRVIGFGRSAERLAGAKANGLIDECRTESARAAAESDLIIFCTPVDRIAAGVLEFAPHCRTGTILTDAGSVKDSICRQIEANLPGGVTFIGSHPLAGSEKQGFEHADADLFVDRVCVVTPLPQTGAHELQRVVDFWQQLGMTVVRKSPDEHDRLLAATSHFPHMVAAALALHLTDENRSFVASGFRDTTRIAGSDPALWDAIFAANAQHVTAELDRFVTTLERFRTAITADDRASLQNLLRSAKTNRDRLD
ncbi:MAG: prephenate dehydrogenase/arogenate dehydrogenase family protein [Planctomycetes bacterium]|nr:prephenate dehydrogenase/arogenate dehydrogenase family protein [Planctomycetota bacterium]